MAIHLLYSQPQFINPKPSPFHNKKIVFTDAQTGFILNYNGDLIKTTNQGNTWELAYSFYQASAFDVKDSVVIVAGSLGIYISLDNGNTFVKSLSTFPKDLIDVDIVNRDTIFMLGQNTFCKSVDGGNSWQITNMGGVNQSCFDFIDSKIGFIGRTNTSMLKTVDGGQTWQQILNSYTSSSRFFSVKFLNRDIAYAWRESDSLYKTVDCGVSWTTYRISSEIHGMSFPNNTDGYLVGESGNVWTTRDAGANWAIGTYPGDGFNRLLISVYFINPDIGFTVGLNGQISKTVDGGITWQRNTIAMNKVRVLSFPSSNVGYVGLSIGGHQAYKTTDGAKNWTKLSGLLKPDVYNRNYEQAHFFSPDTGFFTVSNPATLYKTNDGGTTWRESKFFANEYGTPFEENPEMSVVGDSTIFLLLTNNSWGTGWFKSKDRGESWEKIDSSTRFSPSLSNIFFLSEKTGYATRNGYLLLKTVDSAKNWTIIKEHFNIIKKIYFLNEAEGFMIDEVSLKRTSDSGKTWSVQEIDGSLLIPKSISFASDKIGYLTTKHSQVFKTVNAGQTWQLFGNTARDCNIMVKGREGGLYTGGEEGIISYLAADTSWGSSWGKASGCNGGNFTFIADSGIGRDIHQWEVNKDSVFTDIIDDGIYSGSNSYKLTVHNFPAEWTNYEYRCRLSYSPYPPFRYTKIYNFQFKVQWTGAVDNNWENTGNWSCGVVPTKNTDVLISSGSVILNQSATIRSLQISPNVSFTINPGVTLTILY